MPEHRKTLRHLLFLGQREAVPTITPGVSAQLNRLDHVSRRTQQVTSRSLNARDEFLLSRAFSLGHRRNFWISALLIQSPNLASHSDIHAYSYGYIYTNSDCYVYAYTNTNTYTDCHASLLAKAFGVAATKAANPRFFEKISFF